MKFINYCKEEKWCNGRDTINLCYLHALFSLSSTDQKDHHTQKHHHEHHCQQYQHTQMLQHINHHDTNHSIMMFRGEKPTDTQQNSTHTPTYTG